MASKAFLLGLLFLITHGFIPSSPSVSASSLSSVESSKTRNDENIDHRKISPPILNSYKYESSNSLPQFFSSSSSWRSKPGSNSNSKRASPSSTKDNQRDNVVTYMDSLQSALHILQTMKSFKQGSHGDSFEDKNNYLDSTIIAEAVSKLPWLFVNENTEIAAVKSGLLNDKKGNSDVHAKVDAKLDCSTALGIFINAARNRTQWATESND